MPKRKTAPSPPQPSLATFLPARKQSSALPAKKAKLVDAPAKEEAGPLSPCPSTASAACPSTAVSPREMMTLFEYLDESLLFAGTPLLWSAIQEEIYSLHRRNITLEHLRMMMAAFDVEKRDFYTIGTGYKKMTQGGYTPEYKLSIPEHQRRNRIRRFQHAIYNPSMSEYTLPALEKKPPSLHTTKKEIVIKRPTTPKPASAPPPSQKPINVFLTPSKPTTTTPTLASRQASLLERIRSRPQTPTAGKKQDTAAWDRGEWIIRGLFTILAQRGTRTRVAVSLAGTAKQLAASSGTPCSAGEVRAGIMMLAECVPWFVRVIRVVGEGCLSSPSTPLSDAVSGAAKVVVDEDSDDEETDAAIASEVMGKRVFGGKENRGAREVEGLLIFAKRDGGGIIGQEDVLREFRGKKREWEMSTI